MAARWLAVTTAAVAPRRWLAVPTAARLTMVACRAAVDQPRAAAAVVTTAAVVVAELEPAVQQLGQQGRRAAVVLQGPQVLLEQQALPERLALLGVVARREPRVRPARQVMLAPAVQRYAPLRP